MTATDDGADGHRLYGELAAWWPLISPPDEYQGEAELVGAVLTSAAEPVHHVLELGSGGGHNAVHLQKHFAMTLVDLSGEMLAVSRRLNPNCAHVLGDMRTIRLGRTYDAVFVHDAIDYMINETDLRHVVDTAFTHCRPGGVAVFVPDHLAETFEPSTEHGGGGDDAGRGARYLGWTWDPDPDDAWVQTDYAFLLRHADASVQVVHETHRTGLFGRSTWLRILAGAGFEPSSLAERTEEDRVPRELFIGRRP